MTTIDRFINGFIALVKLVFVVLLTLPFTLPFIYIPFFRIIVLTVIGVILLAYLIGYALELLNKNYL